MPSSDLNLLFGILALQLNFITREALISAMGEWVLAKEKPLGELLQASENLTAERRQLLDALVQEHLRQHAGDAKLSLAAMSSIDSVHEVLQEIADPDLLASAAHLSRGGPARQDVPTMIFSPRGAGKSHDGPEATALGTRLRILRPHAKGGLGQVSVALDEELHREVALKEIQSQHADNTDSRSRFVLEAEITGRLEHPGIVPVYGLGHYADGRPFYAMRFIQGDSLKAAIELFHHCTNKKPTTATADDQAERNVQFRQLMRRFVDVCNTMAYAHSRGILHRDLKPGNIMVGKYGETLVVDWGLAKSLGHGDRSVTDGEKETTLLPASSGSSETLPGLAIGTPGYMSPEQAAGKLDQLGPTCDVYSLGATLYHILTGQAPFVGRDVPEILEKVQKGEFPKPSQIQPETPRALEAICLRAMALKPEDRYPSPKLLADEIEHWLADEPVRALHEGIFARSGRWIRKHRAWALSGTVALALVAIVSSTSAFWINGQNEVITQKERTANRLAIEKTKLAADKTQLAALEKSARAKADKNATAADRQTKLAMRHLYVSHMNLVQAAWERARVSQCLQLLDLYRPRAGQDPDPNDPRGFEWYYWDRLCHSELVTLRGHTSGVKNVTYSPDGSRLASASYDQTVKVWDAASGQELFTLKGCENANCVVFSPDGKWLASAGGGQSLFHNSWSGVVKIWDAAIGQEMLTLKGHTDGVNSVAFSPDGKQLVSTGRDQTVKLWDAISGQEVRTLDGHSNGVSGVAFSPDGKHVVAGSNDNTVKIWDAASGQIVSTLEGHVSLVRCVTFSPDGRRLASASDDQTVKVWDATSGQETLTLQRHNGSVWCVRFSADGKWLASASGDRTVKVWDATNGQEKFTLIGHTSSVSCVAISPDGTKLASASFDETVKIWDAIRGQEMLTLKGPVSPSKSVAFSPNGKWLASASWDQSVMIWDTKSGEVAFTLKAHTGNVNSVAFSPDGRWLASAGGQSAKPGEVKLWDLTSGEVKLTLNGHSGAINSVVFSPDGKWLASAGGKEGKIGEVKLWNATSGQELHTFQGHTGEVHSVAFSIDGRLLATGSAYPDNTVKVWNAASAREMFTLKGHTSSVGSVAFSPDGNQLVSAGYDNTVKIWDYASGRELITLESSSKVSSAAYCPDGKRIAATNMDGTIKLWDIMSGQETLTLNGGGSVAFSADGNQLAAKSDVYMVKLWDATPLPVGKNDDLPPSSPPFCDLNAVEFQQAFDKAVKQRLRPSKLWMSVAPNGTPLFSGVLIPDDDPSSKWVARHALSAARFDQIHAEMTAKGFQLESHAFVTLTYMNQKIHAAVWGMK